VSGDKRIGRRTRASRFGSRSDVSPFHWLPKRGLTREPIAGKQH
jgi:hypothetical protein